MMKKAFKYFQRASCAKARFHPTGEEGFFHHSIRMGEAVLPPLRRCKRAAVVNTAISHIRLAMTPSLPVCGI
jgi:hypothetical protein